MATPSNNDGLYAVVWPSGERKQQMRPLAKRLDTLNGKTIAQLWDFLFVSGDPLRTNAYTFAHNGYLGFPTAKQIQLPKHWAERIPQRKVV